MSFRIGLAVLCPSHPSAGVPADRISWLRSGRKVFPTDLREDDPGFDGTRFAREYRRTRLQTA